MPAHSSPSRESPVRQKKKRIAARLNTNPMECVITFATSSSGLRKTTSVDSFVRFGVSLPPRSLELGCNRSFLSGESPFQVANGELLKTSSRNLSYTRSNPIDDATQPQSVDFAPTGLTRDRNAALSRLDSCLGLVLGAGPLASNSLLRKFEFGCHSFPANRGPRSARFLGIE